jgi:hypothetical protein
MPGMRSILKRKGYWLAVPTAAAIASTHNVRKTMPKIKDILMIPLP